MLLYKKSVDTPLLYSVIKIDPTCTLQWSEHNSYPRPGEIKAFSINIDKEECFDTLLLNSIHLFQLF